MRYTLFHFYTCNIQVVQYSTLRKRIEACLLLLCFLLPIACTGICIFVHLEAKNQVKLGKFSQHENSVYLYII